MKIALVVMMMVAIAAGCAQTPARYLSDEEDAKLRSQCEPAGGCAMVPIPLWQKIEQLLRSLAGQRT